MRTAAHLVFGSEFIADWHRRENRLQESAPWQVVPYELPDEPIERQRQQRRMGRPLRCGFIGVLLPHKGLHVIVEAFRSIDPRDATLDIFGNERADPAYTDSIRQNAVQGVSLRGTYDVAQQASLFENIDLLLVPSVGLESFGMVIAEAARHGVPAMVSPRGALTETAARYGGLAAPGEDPHSWRRGILEASRSGVPTPDFQSRWQRHVDRILDIHYRAVSNAKAGGAS